MYVYIKYTWFTDHFLQYFNAPAFWLWLVTWGQVYPNFGHHVSGKTFQNLTNFRLGCFLLLNCINIDCNHCTLAFWNMSKIVSREEIFKDYVKLNTHHIITLSHFPLICVMISVVVSLCCCDKLPQGNLNEPRGRKDLFILQFQDTVHPGRNLKQLVA